MPTVQEGVAVHGRDIGIGHADAAHHSILEIGQFIHTTTEATFQHRKHVFHRLPLWGVWRKIQRSDIFAPESGQHGLGMVKTNVVNQSVFASGEVNSLDELGKHRGVNAAMHQFPSCDARRSDSKYEGQPSMMMVCWSSGDAEALSNFGVSFGVSIPHAETTFVNRYDILH